MIGVKLFAIETDVQKKRRVNAITKRCIVGFPSSVNYGQRTRLGTVREAASLGSGGNLIQKIRKPVRETGLAGWAVLPSFVSAGEKPFPGNGDCGGSRRGGIARKRSVSAID
jgi:hypothetical protein